MRLPVDCRTGSRRGWVSGALSRREGVCACLSPPSPSARRMTLACKSIRRVPTRSFATRLVPANGHPGIETTHVRVQHGASCFAVERTRVRPRDPRITPPTGALVRSRSGVGVWEVLTPAQGSQGSPPPVGTRCLRAGARPKRPPQIEPHPMARATCGPKPAVGTGGCGRENLPRPGAAPQNTVNPPERDALTCAVGRSARVRRRLREGVRRRPIVAAGPSDRVRCRAQRAVHQAETGR
jgi:hypothetical protein